MNEQSIHPCSTVELIAEPPINSSPANDLSRCQHRTRTGRRCRQEVSNVAAGLCSKHAAARPVRFQESDLSVTLLGQLTQLKSASDLNQVLSNLFRLLSQDRIAARRAAVLAYIGNLLLRTLPAIAQEANPAGNRPQRIIIDMPEPDRGDPRPENPTYADLRS
jgi:hypothetical protein